MKAYFIGLVIMGGCLLYGCHTKQKKGENGSDYSADSQSIARQDTLPLPTDTHAASSVSTEGWTAKQIRDSIELFFGKEYDTLPPHLRKIRRNMTSLWNTDDSVFLQLIIVEAPYSTRPSSGSAEALTTGRPRNLFARTPPTSPCE